MHTSLQKLLCMCFCLIFQLSAPHQEHAQGDPEGNSSLRNLTNMPSNSVSQAVIGVSHKSHDRLIPMHIAYMYTHGLFVCTVHLDGLLLVTLEPNMLQPFCFKLHRLHLSGSMGKVCGKRVVHEKPWKVRMKHGQRNKKRWVRELWQLEVANKMIWWCGLCWANVAFTHITETWPLDGGKVEKVEEPISGTQHYDQYGRADIKLKVPGHGQTYLHILCWYYFHNNGKYKSWEHFRKMCKTQELQVDHGAQGCFRRFADGWRSYTDVHVLSLKPRGANCEQGMPLRQAYTKKELEFQKRKAMKEK